MPSPVTCPLCFVPQHCTLTFIHLYVAISTSPFQDTVFWVTSCFNPNQHHEFPSPCYVAGSKLREYEESKSFTRRISQSASEHGDCMINVLSAVRWHFRVAFKKFPCIHMFPHSCLLLSDFSNWLYILPCHYMLENTWFSRHITFSWGSESIGLRSS